MASPPANLPSLPWFGFEFFLLDQRSAGGLGGEATRTLGHDVEAWLASTSDAGAVPPGFELAAQRWTALAAAERQAYVNKADEDRRRFDTEFEERTWNAVRSETPELGMDDMDDVIKRCGARLERKCLQLLARAQQATWY